MYDFEMMLNRTSIQYLYQIIRFLKYEQPMLNMSQLYNMYYRKYRNSIFLILEKYHTKQINQLLLDLSNIHIPEKIYSNIGLTLYFNYFIIKNDMKK